MGDVQATSHVSCALYLSRFQEIYRRCCPLLTKFYAKIKLHIYLLRSVYLFPINKGMPSITCSSICLGGIPVSPMGVSEALETMLEGFGISDRRL